MTSTLPIALVLATLAGAAGAGEATPIEVGRVSWGRDLDAALRESAKSGKPVFAFFQEVPGCAGCQTFGREVMSHPPLVAAIEREFLPVLIYNNRRGRDAELLERFAEPAWNYQVVRFLDGRGNDLIPRRDRVFSRPGIAARMIAALEAAARPVPGYLQVEAWETDGERHASAAFAQACFWTGETTIGRIPGVLTTEAGWIAGGEVTLVRYHTGSISLETLIETVAAEGAGEIVFVPEGEPLRRARALDRLPVRTLDESHCAESEVRIHGSSQEPAESEQSLSPLCMRTSETSHYRTAQAADQKRQIRGSALSRLDLSPMQRTKVNSFAPLGLEHALEWLTPAQRQRLARRR